MDKQQENKTQKWHEYEINRLQIERELRELGEIITTQDNKNKEKIFNSITNITVNDDGSFVVIGKCKASDFQRGK